jgi:surface antigen
MEIESRRPSRFARVSVRVALVLGVLVALSATSMIAVVGAKPHASRPRKHRPHPQALSGPAKKAHVKIVTVLIKGGKGGISDPGDDYPSQWRNVPQDSRLDQWLEYNRECTSFAAWALYSRNGFVMPFHDNANNWGPRAAKLGYPVNSTPAVGSVAWSNAGLFGHVAYVVAVSGGGVTIEEYNHFGNGTYDKRTVPAATFTGYIHFKDPAPEVVPTEQPPSTTPASPGAGSPPPSHAETTGGVTHTWTNYTNAGGTQGPSIPSNATVQIACALSGFRVADGNTWWYRIASSPWNSAYYASADAFYNNGQTSGSLIGTPFVDPAVSLC